MGAMGRALAAALVASGRSVTVWNRTVDPVGRSVPGATVAASVADAVAASPLVVVCVVNYDAMYSFLDPALVGDRTLVNLTNGTPQQARDAAARFGSSYVDGGIMAVPAMIGSASAAILYSGSAAGFAAAEPVFAVWGTAKHLGEDPGLASLYDLALLSAMYGMFGGVYHALALTASEKVEPAEFLPMVKSWLGAMVGALSDGSGADSADSNLAMQATAYVNLLDASRDQGVRTDMVTAMGELLHRGVAAGPGVSLVDLLRA